MRDDMQNLSVRDLRVRRRWTQSRLAAVAGVALRTVVRAEQGEQLSPLKQQAIAEALGVERLELFPEEVA